MQGIAPGNGRAQSESTRTGPVGPDTITQVMFGSSEFRATLAQLDTYLDAAPRTGADAIEVGPFTMFVHRGPWGYYARPGSHRGPNHHFTSTEVETVLAAQRERGENESLEWVHDVDSSLADACEGAGLRVVYRPLLTIDASTFDPVPHDSPEFPTQVLDLDHPQLPMHRSVAHVAFRHAGTQVGTAGATDRDAAPYDEAAVAWAIERSRLGHTIAVAAFDPVGGMVGVGSAQPVIDPTSNICAAELTGIAVLPTHRRRGIAGSITSALITECAARGIQSVLLSAQDDDVARVYERVGFRRVGTFAEAAPNVHQA